MMAGNMSGSLNSRQQGTVQTKRPRPPQTKISCNRCRKYLSTTVFVCSCDCVFCEECTSQHFAVNPQCPSCGTTLKESDLMECNVADVSATAPAANACLKSLFTKSSEALPHLSFVDMSGQLLQQYETLKTATKFFVKQTIKDSMLWAQRHHLAIRQNGSLKQEVLKLRQENTNRKVETDQVIANLQEKVSAMQQKNTGMQQKLEEKDRQLSQFRKLHEGMTPESPRRTAGIPPSASGSGGGGVIVGARRVSGDLQPPLKGFLLQKEAQERAKQQALAQSQGHRPMILGGNPYIRQGRPSSSEHSFMTPPTQAVDGIDTGRIRSLNSNTGFAFSSQVATQHINKRRRGQPSNSDSHQGAISPSHAFAHGHSGGQTAARGPATYFQQTNHPR